MTHPISPRAAAIRAARTGLAYSTVHRAWHTGRCTLGTIDRIAAATGTTTGALLGVTRG